MRTLKSLKIALASSVLLTSIAAQAGSNDNKKIAEKNDWSLWETKSTGVETCYLQANDSDYYMLLLKPKNNPNQPVEMMLQLTSNGKKNTAMTASIPGVNSQIAAPDLNGKLVNYWGIPKNLSLMMEIMKAGKEKVKVIGTGGKKPTEANISTKGFADMLSQMQTRCNGGLPLVNSELETGLLSNVADNVDPLKLDINKIGQIRSIYYAANSIALNIDAGKAELAAVLQKYQPLTDELNQNRATTTRLQTVDVPNAQAVLADAQRQQVDARNEIARIDALIPPLAAKVAASQKAYDAARAILAPHQPEYDRLTSGLSNAQSTLSQSQNRLSYIDTRLSDGAAQINSLSYEADNIDRNLPQKRANRDMARRYLRDAEAQRANFNVIWERDQRLRMNFEYNNLLNNRSSMDGQIAQLDREVNQISAERNRIARDLEICRAGMTGTEQLTPGQGHEPKPPGGGNPGTGGGLVPGPSQGNGGGLTPGGPGNGGGGLVPGGPGEPGGGDGGGTVTPAQPDCSQLEAALANANNMLAQKQNARNTAMARRNEINNRLVQIERDVDYQVRREYEILVNREDQARRETSRLEDDVNRDESRLSQIRLSDIPRLQREQADLGNERPGVLARISSSSADIERLSRELSDFKVRTDYDKKAAAVDSTGRQLSSDQSNLASAQAQKTTAQRNLEKGALLEAQTKAQIDSLNLQIASLNKRAAELQTGLSALPAERAPIDAKIATLRDSMQSRQNQILDLLK